MTHLGIKTSFALETVRDKHVPSFRCLYLCVWRRVCLSAMSQLNLDEALEVYEALAINGLNNNLEVFKAVLKACVRHNYPVPPMVYSMKGAFQLPSSRLVQRGCCLPTHTLCVDFLFMLWIVQVHLSCRGTMHTPDRRRTAPTKLPPGVYERCTFM